MRRNEDMFLIFVGSVVLIQSYLFQEAAEK